MSLAPLHDVSIALAEPDLDPLARLVLILAQTNPGNHLVAERAACWTVSEPAFCAAVRKLIRKGYILPAKPDDGQISLVEVP